ncbi:MAG: exopolysaccharide biosynthesis protein [Hyphomonadaceae bacterium]
MDAAHTHAPKHKALSTSDLLEEVAGGFPNERVTVGELLDRLEGRAIGVVLLILALPMCIPNIPGISTIFGVLLLAPAFQLILGGKRLWLPRQMRVWTFPREGLQRTVHGATPTLRRIERLIRPRFELLAQFPFTIFLGLQTLLNAIVLIIPIPGGNWPPAIVVSITALALLQRDGLLAAISAALTAASTVAAYYFFKFGVFAMKELGLLIASWWPF